MRQVCMSCVRLINRDGVHVHVAHAAAVWSVCMREECACGVTAVWCVQWCVVFGEMFGVSCSGCLHLVVHVLLYSLLL